jgi:hypothetical protein
MGSGKNGDGRVWWRLPCRLFLAHAGTYTIATAAARNTHLCLALILSTQRAQIVIVYK